MFNQNYPLIGILFSSSDSNLTDFDVLIWTALNPNRKQFNLGGLIAYDYIFERFFFVLNKDCPKAVFLNQGSISKRIKSLNLQSNCYYCI